MNDETRNETTKETLFYNLARPAVRALEAYDPGPMPADVEIRVSANENNMGVPPKAREALLLALENANRYPESRCTALRELLAAHHGLTPGHFIVGNGLDGVITMFGRAFLGIGDEVICGELTFSVYADTARVMGATPVAVPLTPQRALDPEAFARAVTPKTKMLFYCNPNNPTGTLAGLPALEKMLDAVPQNVLVVLDEAYIEFADDPVPTVMPLLARYPNLIVCRTFSKLYGLAGLRVGYAAADPALLEYLYKVREPYAVSTLSAAAAESALRDNEYCENARRLVRTERQKLCDFFDRLGVPYIPSQANFITLTTGTRTPGICAALLEKGIVTRLLTDRGNPEILRVSIGLEEENAAFMRAFAELYAKR